MIIKAATLAVLIILSVAFIQMFFQVRTAGTINVNIGFPYRIFFFSIDGNALQGSDPIGFIKNFLITSPIVFLCYFAADFTLTRRKNQTKKES